MKIEELKNAVLILALVALIVGASVLILDKFAETVKTPTTVAYGSENVTLAGGAGTLTHDDVTALNAIGNSSVNFTVGTQVNLSSGLGGTIVSSYPSVPNGSYYVGYAYKANNSASSGVVAGRDAVSTVSTDWLGIIVVIIALAVILGMIIRSFGGQRR